MLRLAMPIRAVLFDLGDTLFRLDPIAASTSADLARLLQERTSLNVADAGRVAESLGERVSTYANGLGDGSELREIDIAEESLRLVSSAGAIVTDATGEAVATLFSAADIARFRPSDDCAARVATFRRAGLRLAIVSNTSSVPAMMAAFLARVGLYELFDGTVFSSEVGWRKPDRRIYEVALGALAVSPADALFVGDRVLQDVLGPQSIGIRAVLTHEFRQEDVGNARPLAVVQRLDDLHGAIAQARG